MKNIISIIFAALVLVILIVLLPLFSILDRQDTMSYNFVLTKTTAFIDEIRANGFITLDSYREYINSLESTGNTYKVNFETYKTVLLREDTDTYSEKKELYNTQDITKFLENANVNKDVNDSNIKENVFLLNENDEIYVRVYNTNTTPGGTMYNMLISTNDSKVIDITYGGKIKKVNWELYTKIKNEKVAEQDIRLSIPRNSKGEINAKKLVDDKELIDLECFDDDLADLFSGAYELCSDLKKGDIYQYIYDLDKPENKVISFYVDVKDAAYIKVGSGEYKYIGDGAEEGLTEEEQKYIIENYIILNGMTVNNKNGIQISTDDNYHVMKITLNGVEMENLSNISTMASVAILPGLIQGESSIPTSGVETVPIQLTHRSGIKEVVISGPYNWNKFKKTKNLEASEMKDGYIYDRLKIFFKVQYSGISDSTYEVKNAIKNNIQLYEQISSEHSIQGHASEIEYYTPTEMFNEYGITIETDTIIVKMEYMDTTNHPNYFKIKEGWYEGMKEAKSPSYKILGDSAPPLEPIILLDGIIGQNGWYVSDVTATLMEREDRSSKDTIGGVGTYYSTMEYEYKFYYDDEELILTESRQSVHYITAVSYDYKEQYTRENSAAVLIDKEAPNEPTILVNSEAPKKAEYDGDGNLISSEWYNKDVTISIIENGDEVSGVERVTFEVSGQKNIEETEGSVLTLTESGIFKVTANVYDVAGNKISRSEIIKIDKGEPPKIKIEVIEGSKSSPDIDWYNTNVKVRILLEPNGDLTDSIITTFNVNNGADETIIGTVKDIVLTENGTHNISVTSRNATIAEKTSTADYTVKIDKAFPNAPKIYINDVLITENSEETLLPDWFASDVRVRIEPLGDVGGSGLKRVYYEVEAKDIGIFSSDKTMEDNLEFTITKEGINELRVLAEDNAGNESEFSTQIKLDKTAADVYDIKFSSEGVTKKKDWYNSDVDVAFELKEEHEEVSGLGGYSYTVINDGKTIATGSEPLVKISTEGQNKLTFISEDKAGNKREYTEMINIDKTSPKLPNIELPEGIDINEEYMENVSLTTTVYTNPVTVNIIHGLDELSGAYKTTYIVYKDAEEYKSREVYVNSIGNQQFDLIESGRYSIMAKTYDNAGNYSEKSVAFVIELDGAPKVKFEVPESVKGKNDWCKKAVDLKIIVETTSDEYSPIAKILGTENMEEVEFQKEKTLKFDTNGIHNIKVETTTWFGLTAINEFTLKIDSLAPNMPTVNISGTEGMNGWYKEDVNLTTILGGDNGGSGEMPYSYEVTNNGVIVNSGKDMPTNSVITIATEGINEVKIIAEDGAGNETVWSETIKIDKTMPPPPMATVTGMSKNDWYISDVNVKMTLYKDQGGSKADKYSYEVINRGVIVQTGYDMTSNSIITLTTDGINTVKVKVQDGAGNVREYSITVRIDKSLANRPNLTINGGEGENGWHRGSTEVIIPTVADSGITGLASYSYEVVNNGTVLFSEQDKTGRSAMKLSTEGINEINITLKDSSGKEKLYKEIIKIDHSAPTEPIIKLPTQIEHDMGPTIYVYNNYINIDIEPGEDYLSEVQKTTYTIIKDGSTYVSEKQGTHFSVKESGMYSIIARTYDNAGNYSEKSVAVLIQ